MGANHRRRLHKRYCSNCGRKTETKNGRCMTCGKMKKGKVSRPRR